MPTVTTTGATTVAPDHLSARAAILPAHQVNVALAGTGRHAGGGAPEDGPALAAVAHDLAAYVDGLVAGGFLARRAILASARIASGGTLTSSGLTSLVGVLTRDSLVRHARLEPGRSLVTDCGRLDRAFEELELLDIVARQNFTGCGTCGVERIDRELDHARAARNRRKPRCVGRGCTSSMARRRQDP